jgi:hypothetical protein
VALLSPLTPDQRTTLLVVSLTPKALRKLVGRLGTAPSGTRLETMSPWDLAWSLVDYYESDLEVAREVDRTVQKELGTPPLLSAARGEGAPDALADLVLSSRDPLRELAWALLAAGGQAAEARAAELVEAIVKEFDDADARAKAEEEEAAAAPPEAPPGETEAERLAREKEKEASQAQRARARALKRVDNMKDRVVELETGLAAARRELRAAEEARTQADAERDRLARERDALKTQLQSGTAGEVSRLRDELEAAQRRLRNLDAELEEARESEAALSTKVRELSDRRPAQAATAEETDGGAAAATATWSLPIFSDEFYESIRRWDRKIIRNAFEKIHRLADDWRHPSLRAIPLEGLPGCYRIRVATDVRLIYRPLDGNRVEIMSLIDREDLQRYIRQAKTRTGTA